MPDVSQYRQAAGCVYGRFFSLCAVSVLLFSVISIPPRNAAAQASGARVALLVGVADYENVAPLKNPINDLELIFDALEKQDFTIHRLRNPSYEEFDKKISEIVRSNANLEEIFFYYAGHGMTALIGDQLENVLLPIDASVSCATRAASRAILMSDLFQAFRGVRHQTYLFDACRDDPISQCDENSLTTALNGFQPARSVVALGDPAPPSTGEAENDTEPARGFLTKAATRSDSATSLRIMYSTSLGSTASDGEGDNSPFAESLGAAIQGSPRTPLRRLLSNVSSDVFRNTAGLQRPWVTISGDAETCLAGNDCETSQLLRKQRTKEYIERLAASAEESVLRGDFSNALELALLMVESSDDVSFAGEFRGAVLKLLRKIYYSSPLRQIFSGHNSPVHKLAVDPHKRYVASASDDNKVRLWNEKTAEEVFGPLSFTGHISVLEFSSDGRYLAAASWDGLVRVIDLKRLTVVVDENILARIEAGGFVNDSSAFAAIHNAGFDYLEIDGDGVSRRHRKDGAYAVYEPGEVSPDGTLIAFLPNDEEIQIFDAATAKLRRTISRDSSQVTSLVFDPAGMAIATADFDGMVKLWDVSSGIKTAQSQEVISGAIQHIEFNKDGSLILAVSNRTVTVLNTENGELASLYQGHGDTVRRAAFSRSGRNVVSVSIDGQIRIWNGRTAKEHRSIVGHKGMIRDVAIGPQGRHIFTASADATVRSFRFFGPESATVYFTDGAPVVTSADLASSRIAIGQGNGTVDVFEIGGGSRIGRFEYADMLNESWVNGVSVLKFFDSGRKLFVARPFAISSIDLETEHEEVLFSWGEFDRFQALFNARNRLAVIYSAAGDLRIFSIGDGGGTSIKKIEGGAIAQAILSGDDRYLIVLRAAGAVEYYDLSSLDGVFRVDIGAGGEHFSPKPDSSDFIYLDDGWITQFSFEERAARRVAFVGWGSEEIEASPVDPREYFVKYSDETALIFVFREPEQKVVDVFLAGAERESTERAGILYLRFSPDGRRLVVYGGGNLLEVFDTESRVSLVQLKAHLDVDDFSTIYDAKFVGNNFLISSGRDRASWLWPLPGDDELLDWAQAWADRDPSIVVDRHFDDCEVRSALGRFCGLESVILGGAAGVELIGGLPGGVARQRAQTILKQAGFYQYEVDGLWGKGSRAALKAALGSLGVESDGALSEDDLQILIDRFSSDGGASQTRARSREEPARR